MKAAKLPPLLRRNHTCSLSVSPAWLGNRARSIKAHASQKKNHANQISHAHVNLSQSKGFDGLMFYFNDSGLDNIPT